MPRRAARVLLVAGLALLVLLIAGRAGVVFYTDLLWFDEVGYRDLFWRRLGIVAVVRGAAAVLAAVVVFLNLWLVTRHLGPVRLRRRYGNLEIAEQVPRRYVLTLAVVLAVLGGWWLAQLQFDDAATLALATWARREAWGLADPVFGLDVAFYVLTLPVLVQGVDFLLLTTVWSLALVTFGHVLVGGVRWVENRLAMSGPARVHLAGLLAAMILLLGLRYWLGRYLLLVEGSGVGGGLGYTDAHARMMAHWVMTGLAVAAAATLVWGARRVSLVPPVIGLGLLLAGALLVVVAYPALVQKFQVEPNELSREAPFIAWHIDFTRRAYALDDIERERMPYRSGARPEPDRVDPVVTRLPLWEPEPLQRAFDQTQALFQYFRFPDLDYDRYGPPGEERQVIIGVREFYAEGLPQSNRTWQSLRLNPDYIRGMGAVVAPAHPRDPEGPPELWLRDVRPVIRDPAAPPELELRNPSIFFGETMTDYVVVVPGRDSAFTGEPGRDYPEGVPLSSFFRVLAFAWRFGEENLLFSGEITRSSRMLFRRALRERLDALAPFVLWDADALPVIADGRIVWLIDGYTVSSHFPLARAVTLGRGQTRYLRNAVKATVDAVTGEVSLYRLDPDEPLLTAYGRVFPGLFRPLTEMPATLRSHLRYPEMALLTQAEILQEYHVDRPEVFYSGQNVWQRPQETSPAGGVRDYRPAYMVAPRPLSGGAEFVASLPFIARARQNMTAVLLAGNDPDVYGRLRLLELPRDLQVPGPSQVQAVIEQEPFIARELSLLRARGSGVDMGRLRVLPIDSTVLYVQPMFLSAEETPIPELWRVVVSDGRNVTMAAGVAPGLAALQFPVTEIRPGTVRRGEPQPAGAGTRWSREALDLLERAERRLREGDWAGYGQALDELRSLLERVDGQGADGGGGR